MHLRRSLMVQKLFVCHVLLVKYQLLIYGFVLFSRALGIYINRQGNAQYKIIWRNQL